MSVTSFRYYSARLPLPIKPFISRRVKHYRNRFSSVFFVVFRVTYRVRTAYKPTHKPYSSTNSFTRDPVWPNFTGSRVRVRNRVRYPGHVRTRMSTLRHRVPSARVRVRMGGGGYHTYYHGPHHYGVDHHYYHVDDGRHHHYNHGTAMIVSVACGVLSVLGYAIITCCMWQNRRPEKCISKTKSTLMYAFDEYKIYCLWIVNHHFLFFSLAIPTLWYKLITRHYGAILL